VPWNVVAAVAPGFPMVIPGTSIISVASRDADPLTLYFCFTTGAFPGFVIGMHCELDR
jgi:hypothetical protein